MQAVRNKLTSETPEEFKGKETVNRRAKTATIAILVIYMLVSTIIDFKYYGDEDKEKEPYTIFDGILRVTKFVIDMYLYVMFVRLYIYFLRLKNE